jgi:ATP-dependent helicase/nuclease subunit A
MTAPKEAPDRAQREAAIHARGVNVIADAGAGTGKTTLVVARLVEMVAPADDRLPAVSLARIAAITFTRKAAGELKFRIREALLRALSCSDLTARRRERLASALSLLDTAHVGTIHSFADRLLRLRPVEARLSPSYAIVEDEAELVAETFEVFLHAVEAGTLASELAGTAGAKDAADAEATVLDAQRAGLRSETLEFDYAERAGLDRLLARLIETRDVPPLVPKSRPPDPGRLRDLVGELAKLADGSSGTGTGSRFIARTLERLQRLCSEEDPVLVLKELLRLVRDTPRGERELRKGKDFPGDDAGWQAWKAFKGDGGAKAARKTALRDDLLAPYARWMASRLVALAPAVVAMYEKVKARHRAVDQVDLLLGLRDLLRDRPDVRAEYQALFDHVFVDEFQDTDPLQAEVVLYLCEAGATATTWRDVTVAPGKLTVVGDPKQSIYRFRRADIAVYAEVRTILEHGPHLVAKLTANFRCEPDLIAFLNDRFDDLLGAAEPGKPAFDPAEGTVANERLLAGREGVPAARVEVIPLDADPRRKPEYRKAEAAALAKWLRGTVENGHRAIVDPATGAARPVRYGDVAILVASTFNLSLLFAALDYLGVPYAARGGQVFLEAPLHRQFLLGLRAIADRDDGVAQAALLRPPFFALDYDDLARARAAGEDSTHEGVLRARAAGALVQDLRRRRLDRSPGATARDLLERTAFGRTVALGDNGAQRLDALRELCLALDAIAAAEALDFDGATARVRAWIDEPVKLDPPRPVGTDAVQILTIHQAKGLEFPVVILWDACAELAARERRAAFAVDRAGTSWALALDGLEWSEPADAEFAAQELRYLDAERRRLVYVAATRARDLLVLPVAGEPNPKWISGRLVARAPDELVTHLETFVLGGEPAWAAEVAAPAARPRSDGSALAAEVGAAWQEAAGRAAAPRFSPASVSGEAHRLAELAEMEERDERTGANRPARTSRFGNVFGEAVHRAIGIALAEPALAPAAAVERARRLTGLADHLAEAAEDVRRALAALADAGLRRRPGEDLQLEYPLAIACDGQLLGGYVDLLAASGDGVVTVIDFKTDAPPAGDVHVTHPAYVAQVQGYLDILRELGVATGGVRGGLLFTAEPIIRWI